MNLNEKLDELFKHEEYKVRVIYGIHVTQLLRDLLEEVQSKQHLVSDGEVEHYDYYAVDVDEIDNLKKAWNL